MAFSRPLQIWLIGFSALTVSSLSWSTESVPTAYRTIASERGIPQSIIYAVALTESGKHVLSTGVFRPWPWTLNVAGQGFYFDSKQDAWQALRDWLQTGRRSIDIGLMQINWRYHQDKLGSPWQALDPYHNLRVGAEILQGCYTTRKDWWASIGCYHSPSNTQKAEQYIVRVLSKWQRLMCEG
jgi:hypothetical protein